MRTIAEEWAFFAGQLAGQPPEMLSLLKSMFYAGVAFMIDVAHHVGQDEVSIEEGVEQIEALESECREFIGEREAIREWRN